MPSVKRMSASLNSISYQKPAFDKMLEHANMVILVGKSGGIVGAFGSGKTTAIDILLGLLSPHAGCVLVDDVDILRISEKIMMDGLRVWAIFRK